MSDGGETIKNETISYSIFDNSGKEIQHQTFSLKDAYEFNFSILSADGLYLLRVIWENGTCDVNKVMLSK